MDTNSTRAVPRDDVTGRLCAGADAHDSATALVVCIALGQNTRRGRLGTWWASSSLSKPIPDVVADSFNILPCQYAAVHGYIPRALQNAQGGLRPLEVD